MLRFFLLFAISLVAYVARAQDCAWVTKWDTIPCKFALVANDTTGVVYRITPDTLYRRYQVRECEGRLYLAPQINAAYYLAPDDLPVRVVMFDRRGWGIQFVSD